MAKTKTNGTKTAPKAPVAPQGTSAPPERTAPAAQAPAQQAQAPQAEEALQYPQIKVTKAMGADAITVAQAKEALGWEEETEQTKFGEDFVLMDMDGKKIRLTKNVNNRPIYQAVVDNLQNEILNKRWQFNGEPIIVSKRGLVLNGQHTLIALVLADQKRQGPNKEKAPWGKLWPEGTSCTIDKLIVYGVDDSDSVVNTMDTCKPRSLADVIYRSVYFNQMKTGERRTVARACDFAIRILWYRTGVGMDAFAPRKTHSEALDFLDRHQRVLEAVREVYDLDADKGVSRYIGLGYAAGLLYLMAASGTDGETYRKADPRGENAIDFTRWDQAVDFWKLLSGTDPKFRAVRYEVGSLSDPDSGAIGSLSEKIAVLCKAWGAFVSGKDPIENDDVALEYDVDEESGFKTIRDLPSLGGIDVGDVKMMPKPKKEKKRPVPGVDVAPQEGYTAEQEGESEGGEVEGADPEEEDQAEAEDAELDAAHEEAEVEEEEVVEEEEPVAVSAPKGKGRRK